MKSNIYLFETERGEKPVEEFIKSQNPQTVAKIIREIDLLEKYGHHLSLPHSKKITKELYELRIKGKQEIRIIYVFLRNNIYLLSGFQKQSQKTPKREIKTAERRRKYCKSSLTYWTPLRSLNATDLS